MPIWVTKKNNSPKAYGLMLSTVSKVILKTDE